MKLVEKDIENMTQASNIVIYIKLAKVLIK